MKVLGRIKEADTYSKQALELLPDLPETSGTRGTVLICLGQLKEGKELVIAAEQGLKNPSSLAENAAALAVAAAKENKPERALALMKKARRLDASNKKVEWVKGQLDELGVYTRPAST